MRESKREWDRVRESDPARVFKCTPVVRGLDAVQCNCTFHMNYK